MDAIAEFTSGVWWKVLLQLIGAASMLAMATPNKMDNVILKFLREVLDIFAMNFGNAKNAKKPD